MNQLPERDHTKPAEQQGLFRKFTVTRTDGSDGPGGKHYGCEYFVLDVAHDPHAKAALSAYADAVGATHPQLAADMRQRYECAAPQPAALPELSDAEIGRLVDRMDNTHDSDLLKFARAVIAAMKGKQ